MTRKEEGEEVIRFPERASLYLLSEMRSLIQRELRLLKPAVIPAAAASTPVDREMRVFVRGEQVYVCVCVHVCVRMRVSVHACVRVSVCACVEERDINVCVCVLEKESESE